jgi:hypothetical protein
MRRPLALAAALATAVFLLSALPAAGAVGGTVHTTVIPASTCITVSPSAFDLGVVNFSSLLIITRTIPTQVVSCSSASQKILARGTDATGPGATWTLTSPQPGTSLECPSFVDHFTLRTPDNSVNPDWDNHFGKTDRHVATVGPLNTLNLPTVLTMPCSGSDGGGVQMGFDITFTATHF